MSISRHTIAVALTILFSALGLAATPTTVLLSGEPSPATFGQPVILTASVMPPGASGKVTFYDGVTVLGTRQLTNGQAVMATSLLPAGRHSLRAYYAGDGTFAPGSSTPAPLIVQTIAGNTLQALSPILVSGGLAVADFNGDGKPDLVVGGSVLIGNGDGTFAPPVTYSAGAAAAVAVGDFNGDGYMDIATASADSVSVLLGNGDGTFKPALSYAAGVGGGAGALAVADLNGDGVPDLVVGGQDGISALLGNGDGTFQPPLFYQLPPYVGAIAVGDFNGDGKADLAVANGFINVFLGNGDGTFQPPAVYNTGADALGVAIGDFNGDGKPDLVVQISVFDDGVLLGVGDGTFQPAPNYQAAGLVLDQFAVGDFRGTGADDLVIASGTPYLGGSVDVAVDVAFDNPSGFCPPIAYAVQSAPPLFVLPSGYLKASSVVVADFNGDGRADIAVAAGDYLTVLLGGSVPESVTTVTSSLNPSIYGQSVTFTATVSSSAAVPDSFVVLYDGATVLGRPVLNGGQAVLTTTSLSSGAHPITAVYNGDANVGYSISPVLVQTVEQIVATTSLTVSPNPSSTGQGVLLEATVSSPAATGTVTFMDGSTSLGSRTVSAGLASMFVSSLTIGPHVLTAVYSGDVNVPTSQSDAVSQVVDQGTPTSVALSTSSTPSYYGPNLLIIGTVSPASATGKMTFYDGAAVLGIRQVVNGRATLTTTLLAPGRHPLKAYYMGDATDSPAVSASLPQRVVTLNPSFGYSQGQDFPVNGGWILVDDFNGDGRADLLFEAAGTPESYVEVALGNGDGTFQSPTLVYSGSSRLSAVIADFNSDGIPDVIVADYGASTYNVALGNGDGTFRDPVSSATVPSPSSLVVADFNGDGIPDIVIGSSVLLGNGDGTFQPMPFALPGADYLAVADLNGDGNPDLVLGFLFGSTIRVMLGNGDGTFGAPIVTTGVPAGPFAIADLNGDGKPDLVISGADGNVRVLLGNGDGGFQPSVSYPVGGPAAIGDINGDGKPDIVAGMGVLFGNGDGSFQPLLALSTSYLDNVAVADFNGDGRADIVSSVVGVILGAGRGQLRFTAQPAGGIVGQALPPVVVEVQDPSGNGIMSYAATFVTLTSTPAGVSETVTPVNGIARFSNIFFPAPGSYTMTATSPGLNAVTSQPVQIVSAAGGDEVPRGKCSVATTRHSFGEGWFFVARDSQRVSRIHVRKRSCFYAREIQHELRKRRRAPASITFLLYASRRPHFHAMGGARITTRRPSIHPEPEPRAT